MNWKHSAPAVRRGFLFALALLTVAGLLFIQPMPADALIINGEGGGIEGATSKEDGAYGIYSESLVLGYRLALVDVSGTTVKGHQYTDVYRSSLVNDIRQSRTDIKTLRRSTNTNKYNKVKLTQVYKSGFEVEDADVKQLYNAQTLEDSSLGLSLPATAQNMVTWAKNPSNTADLILAIFGVYEADMQENGWALTVEPIYIFAAGGRWFAMTPTEIAVTAVADGTAYDSGSKWTQVPTSAVSTTSWSHISGYTHAEWPMSMYLGSTQFGLMGASDPNWFALTKRQQDGHGRGTAQEIITRGYGIMVAYAENLPTPDKTAYTVHYDGNGATGGATADSSHVYGVAKNLTANGFWRTGYTFAGWSTVKNGEKVYSDRQSVKNLTAKNGATVTLYAVWKPITYQVHYNAGGGEGAMADSSHIYDRASNLSPNAFTRPGYNFDGWLGEDGKTYRNRQEILNLTEDDGDIFTMTALWEPIHYWVSYHPNQGVGDMEDSLYYYDRDGNLSPNTFTRPGYVFTGWLSEYGEPYSDGEKIRNLTEEDDGEVRLYAQWEPISYTVHYNANGATDGATADSHHVYDVTGKLSANGFSWSGHRFTGWADSQGNAYTDGQEVVNLTATDGAVIQLYAQWETLGYTVHYVGSQADGGDTADSFHLYGVDQALTANGFRRTGYRFYQWNTLEDGTGMGFADLQTVRDLPGLIGLGDVNWDGTVDQADAELVLQYSVGLLGPDGLDLNRADLNGDGVVDGLDGMLILQSAQDMTVRLYARWEPITYTVHYDAGGGVGTMADSTHVYDRTGSLTANAFTRPGYVFAGWKGEDGKTYRDRQEILNLTDQDGAVIRLYAQWLPGDATGYRVNHHWQNTALTGYDLHESEFRSGATGSGLTLGELAKSYGGLSYKEGRVNGSIATTATVQADGSLVIDLYYDREMYTVTLGKGTGILAVAGAGQYPYGATVTVSASVAPGYMFSSWTGTHSKTDREFTFTMPAANVTDTANAVPITYTVHYDANGGTGATADSSHTYGVAKNLTANGFTRPGYTFAGWSTVKNGEKVYSDRQSVSNLTDQNGATVTLYAVWKPITYRVHYDAGGGTGAMADSSHVYDTESSLSPNAFTKPGYTFAGWKGEDGKTYRDRQQILNLCQTEGDVFTVTAMWEPITYTVHYDSNGGTGATADSSHTYDEESDLSPNGFTKPGYIFDGWSNEKDGEKVYSDRESVSNLTDQDGDTVTLYAKWRPITYTVHYDPNGGSGTTANSTHTYGVAKNLTANGFSKPGYIFDGWSNEKDGEKVYSDRQSVSNLTDQNGATVTLYAKWRPITYTVHYDANGGSGTTADSSHTYGVAKNLTANGFSRPGYIFDGWSTVKDGEKVYSDRQSVSNLTDQNGATVTLYAKWRPITYTVHYDANGGTGTTADSHHVYDKESDLTPNGFSRPGYTFAGWSTVKNAAAVYSDRQAVKNLTKENGATVTLYAKWTPTDYTNGISHWAWGFQNGEGNNSARNAFQIGWTTFRGTYGGGFILDKNKAVTVPNGFYLHGEFGTSSISGSWKNYPLGTYVTQKAAAMNFQYSYYPNTYSITYALGGGTNNASNPSSYNVLYGVTLKEPTRLGYIFLGWYLGDQKVTGINQGANANFSGPEDLYAQLADRTTGNLTLTAKWTPVPTLRPILPNAPYRENTQVISSFRVENPGSLSYTGKEGVTVLFQVIDGSTGAILTSGTVDTVIVPAGKEGLVYFKWSVPAEVTGSSVTVKATLKKGSAVWATSTLTNSICAYTLSNTPDTGYEDARPGGWSYLNQDIHKDDNRSWSEWVYENGAFREVTYTVRARLEAVIQPGTGKTHWLENGLWHMRSGYGITGDVKLLLEASGVPAGAYTQTQYIMAMFPEFRYSAEVGKMAVLERNGSAWRFPSTSYGNYHFTPIWFPDEAYTVTFRATDCWTPMGMLTAEESSNSIMISGSMYDDWYIGRG